ncbi:hypothetical protein [Marinibactrum halimedae]|uniref:Uncharacterized protein n=1 Tax=Marinibactrum halimedae TaxID=1444977 RepID=A0AA37WNE4_9GAMM|nr:hypothetical protein [Marinibactrum halimedae]MCD9459435.1 hypothetical protein [Marinibactrum halimedae]GLS27498.1 hypothetical protein GCM10007877_32170 [Marinibactrum halimedae]
MLTEDIQRQVTEAAKKARERKKEYEVLGEEIEQEFGPQGPYFGPRNDIENRRLIDEIRKSDDEK